MPRSSLRRPYAVDVDFHAGEFLRNRTDGLISLVDGDTFVHRWRRTAPARRNYPLRPALPHDRVDPSNADACALYGAVRTQVELQVSTQPAARRRPVRRLPVARGSRTTPVSSPSAGVLCDDGNFVVRDTKFYALYRYRGVAGRSSSATAAAYPA